MRVCVRAHSKGHTQASAVCGAASSHRTTQPRGLPGRSISSGAAARPANPSCCRAPLVPAQQPGHAPQPTTLSAPGAVGQHNAAAALPDYVRNALAGTYLKVGQFVFQCKVLKVRCPGGQQQWFYSSGPSCGNGSLTRKAEGRRQLPHKTAASPGLRGTLQLDQPHSSWILPPIIVYPPQTRPPRLTWH
jgi:hypothetical protein